MAKDSAEGGLAMRYAHALIELAQDGSEVDVVNADLAALHRAMKTSPDLQRLVRSPVFSAEDQVKALRAILDKMGANALTTKFVLLLAQKRRLRVLTQIIQAYEHLIATSRGETEAEVTAARTLSDAEIAELKTVLKSRLGRSRAFTPKSIPPCWAVWSSRSARA